MTDPKETKPDPGPTVLDSLNRALHDILARDPRVYLLGEDILDPYGGAFKVTRGLSTAFPKRVLTSPVSEAGLVGVATGMALRGLRPVVEVMFGDFTTLIADQLANSAAKFRWMYADQVEVPLVVRTPMGGRRGYGPTHSQTLEKHFLGLPGLHVLAPTALGNPGELLAAAVAHTRDPVLYVENKLLYPARLFGGAAREEFTLTANTAAKGSPGYDTPTYTLNVRGAPKPTLTLAAYGYMAELARQAALELAYEHEVFLELVVPTRLAPVEMTTLLDSVRRTGRLLTAEEGTLTLGWGAEMGARTAASLGPGVRVIRRVAAADTPVPASRPLEEGTLPGVPDLVAAALDMV